MALPPYQIIESVSINLNAFSEELCMAVVVALLVQVVVVVAVVSSHHNAQVSSTFVCRQFVGGSVSSVINGS